MNRYDETSGPGIGDALKDARRRIGMDIKEAEERTKIRTRYLRALEAEDWEVLPAPAYVRGFLRVYGQILGLDGELLADRYRRSYEEPAATAGGGAAEPVLSNRGQPPGSRSPSSGRWIVGVAIVIVVLLLILALLGLTSGGSDSGPGGPGGSKQGGAKGAKGSHSAGAGKPTSGGGLDPVDFSLTPLSEVRICLVGDSSNPLIDSQVLTVGATEQFNGEKTYRLDLAGGGNVKLKVGDHAQQINASNDASYQANAKGITEINYAGPDCP